MPPKDVSRKTTPQTVRPSISESSLLRVPEDAIEGYQERIETGIDWTLLALASRHHKRKQRKGVPTVPFTEALENKLKKSILHGFLDSESRISLDDQWNVILTLTIWDVLRFANEEEKVCFHNVNCITNDMDRLIKGAVRRGDRKVLRRDLKNISTLRVNDSEMTELDKGLAEFKKLLSLNLFGNYLANIDSTVLPVGLKTLELQSNWISELSFVKTLPSSLMQLGLGRNLLRNECLENLSHLPNALTVLDLSDNDIYDINLVLDPLSNLPYLIALSLVGNPCAVSMCYAQIVLQRLPRLQWLDSRKILSTDRVLEFEPNPNDLRSSYFIFTVLRIMSAPQPPKPDKGGVATFHVELEIPMLDSARRQFLMFRNHSSLTEMLPLAEDDYWHRSMSTALHSDFSDAAHTTMDGECSPHESDVYKHLVAKDSREICNFTKFESNRVAWNKLMNFQEPTIKIFCPDLVALRDTFRTTVTLKLVYSVTMSGKPVKDKKSSAALSVKPGEHRAVLATIRCSLKSPDWTQAAQHFHWDNSLETNEAIHWGDGDLAVLSYAQTAAKVTKPKEADTGLSTRQTFPENLTCHFSFGIETTK